MTIKVSQILDSKIVDRDGQPLGKVFDLVLEPGVSGTVCYALIGLQTAGDRSPRTVALPWSLLARSNLESGTTGPLMLNVRRSALRNLHPVTGD